MKRLYIIAAALVLSISAQAQTKPMRVESPIVTEKDFVWYTEQKEAWKAITEKEPRNEEAWLNYYHAARYMGWWGNSSDSIAREAIREMSQAIPDTYTYNYCAYHAWRPTATSMPRLRWPCCPTRCTTSTTTIGCVIWP